MSITSFYFLIFYAFILFIYYNVPKWMQWSVLLAASLFYFLTSGNSILILYPLTATAISHFGIRTIVRIESDREELKRKGKNPDFIKRNVLCATVIGILIFLITFKYINFVINTINGIGNFWGRNTVLFPVVNWLVPLGISYYSLSLIGYVADVYFGIAKPENNFGKLAVYGMYFPVMISGPILKYREDGEQFFQPHFFDYTHVTRGMQRMLWGYFKKLIISERMAIIVNTVYGNYADYPGGYIWIGTICFAFQLYTDFSGCMDIVLGMSETFGIRLPENFERPFFSKNISEYWRRWHITLGIWMKEYVFYPLLRTSFFIKFGKKLRKCFGKKWGKQLTTFTAMFFLWFTVGIWHGGSWKYIIGSGLLHWFYIVCGEISSPWTDKVMYKLHLKDESFVMKLFRIFRTFFLVNIGFVFFRAASVSDAVKMLRAATVNNVVDIINGGFLQLGLDWIEIVISIMALFLLFMISLMQRNGSVRDRVADRNIFQRWVIWYALLFMVILLGYYGPGYTAAEFIYQGF
ncbi:membrane-bound O-acyltransferase family protein [Eisenbergiella tayi]|uniref:Peptidoglycan O-acetyltransferase n=1 Tax=Eisenbergiella tayi TaxID=1432052 RepID=A0A1E3AYP5_9FIRM|nr:MBOAT family O-acyltransferase [Eisenbergiella tayi]ODM13326.1 Peptidoglycan O-acetyltransferase [Eisenbergiella tayi]OIZ66001.1 membrane-bound O-acyltransferase family protein [Eisenbergiella tayi]